MRKIISDLVVLRQKGVIAIKQSLEDEGAFYEDLYLMRGITLAAKVDLNVKIGGCEAKSDIFFCKKIAADGIVAPMIESKFAFKKFIDSTLDNKIINKYINIESKLGFENIDEILSLYNKKKIKINGIVIGRSDLTNSLGKNNFVDSKEICGLILKALEKIKYKKIQSKMGGLITVKSYDFIKYLFDKKLLDSVETRNVEILLNKRNIANLKQIINQALYFELSWYRYKLENQKYVVNDYSRRIAKILKRTKF